MPQRNGALDVLRAAAILAVVDCHISNVFAPRGPYAAVLGVGGRGVDLFFLLSGWLLGRQLVTERVKAGTIDVPRFWLRRAFRTLPAYYAVLAVTLAYAVRKGGVGAVDPRYFVFLQNYRAGDTPYFGVTWSLCVEEHFYLAIGPLLLLAGRYRAAGWLAVGLLFVPSGCRETGWYGHWYETHVRYDQCGLGVLLAWVSVCRPRGWAVLARLSPWLAAGLTAVAVRVATGLWIPWEANEANDALFWTLVFASWVLLANSSRWWAEWPHFRATRYLADRAYALYLLHPDAVAVVRRAGEGVGGVPTVVEFVAVWAVGLGLAEGLYRLVERPGMRAREWFRWSRSPTPAVNGTATPGEPVGGAADGPGPGGGA